MLDNPGPSLCVSSILTVSNNRQLEVAVAVANDRGACRSDIILGGLTVMESSDLTTQDVKEWVSRQAATADLLAIVAGEGYWEGGLRERGLSRVGVLEVLHSKPVLLLNDAKWGLYRCGRTVAVVACPPPVIAEAANEWHIATPMRDESLEETAARLDLSTSDDFWQELERDFAVDLLHLGESLLAAAVEDDLDQCAQIAHSVKSSANNMGRMSTGYWAAQVETAARSGVLPKRTYLLWQLCVSIATYTEEILGKS